MNILALDTATMSCSAAALVEGRLAAEIVDVSGETHSRHLMSMVDRVVEMTLGKVSGFDGFAVTCGPGSFTGLRIGISAIKGLAAATGKPVVGVSSLRTLAEQIPDTPHVICTLLDARRGEVYAAGFRYRNGRVVSIRPEAALSPEAAVDGISDSCLLVGDGARVYRERLEQILGAKAVFAPPSCHAIRASTVAFLALDGFRNGAQVDPAALVPVYLRESYADKRRWTG
ncbi:MAG: tRNA (adenosine(37)-N6)-threonylcarbamoyltransferase complex dimerization subunit type 1 TsaB [Desulfobacterales bacterium]